VGNEMREMEDLMNYQKGSGGILDFQVGKGDEVRLPKRLMNSTRSSYHQGELMEEDQRRIMIIGGIEIFLPNNQTEATSQSLGAIEEEGKPAEIGIMREKEKILMSTPVEEEDHKVKILTLWEKE
jgi:hypothetical protein